MKTAIVVEDHADTRDWLQQLLQKAFPEIEVETAPTLEWARELIEKQRFNLALIDMNLPDGSGVELIRELSKKYPDTYCVVATIYDDDEHLFSAMQAGAHGYLLKDQAEAQLLERLRRIADGEPPLSPSIARRILRHFHDQKEIDAAKEVNLSNRETEVLTLIAKGMNRGDIARLLGISSNTAAGYIKTIYQKLNIASRAEATLEAARLGLVQPSGKT